MNAEVIYSVMSFLLSSRILNVVIMGYFDGEVKTLTYNPFISSLLYYLDVNMTSIDGVFPDKLVNLHGYAYKVLFKNSLPQIFLFKGYVYGPNIRFLETVVAKQNATISARQTLDWSINDALNERTVDICLNSDMFVSFTNGQVRTTINTFETDGFCALVPLPGMKSYFDFITKPFDLWTWIFVLASMTCCAIVWRLLNKTSNNETNSSMYYVFGFVSSFLGQAIPFRNHRPMQKIILQLTLMLTFILGTLHQSLMIASIAGSQYRPIITTIDKLLSSDYSYYVDKVFELRLSESEHYQRMSPKIVENYLETLELDYKNLSSMNVVIIATCSNLQWTISNSDSKPFERRSYEFYYMLEEKFNSYYLEFPAADQNFFQKRLQAFSLRILESGIKQKWSNLKLKKTSKDSDQMLSLVNIAPAFYLLASGLGISILTFLMDIFRHDFLFQLDFRKILIKMGRKVVKKCYATNRIILVRPINQDHIEV